MIFGAMRRFRKVKILLLVHDVQASGAWGIDNGSSVYRSCRSSAMLPCLHILFVAFYAEISKNLSICNHRIYCCRITGASLQGITKASSSLGIARRHYRLRSLERDDRLRSPGCLRLRSSEHQLFGGSLD